MTESIVITREVSGYVPLTKEMRDEDAEDRRLFATYAEAQIDAARFDSIITNNTLRQRWLPQRIVHVTVRTVVTVEEVTQ